MNRQDNDDIKRVAKDPCVDLSKLATRRYKAYRDPEQEIGLLRTFRLRPPSIPSEYRLEHAWVGQRLVVKPSRDLYPGMACNV